MTGDEALQFKLHKALKQLMELSEENANLRAENALLTRKLDERLFSNKPNDIESGPILTSKLVCKASEDTLHTSLKSKSEKIAIFRSLFKGREDVFPLRWEKKFR